MATCGENIRELRLKLGVSQRSLAKWIGIRATTICKYEAGVIKPSDKVAYKLIHLAASKGIIVDLSYIRPE